MIDMKNADDRRKHQDHRVILNHVSDPGPDEAMLPDSLFSWESDLGSC